MIVKLQNYVDAEDEIGDIDDETLLQYDCSFNDLQRLSSLLDQVVATRRSISRFLLATGKERKRFLRDLLKQCDDTILDWLKLDLLLEEIEEASENSSAVIQFLLQNKGTRKKILRNLFLLGAS